MEALEGQYDITEVGVVSCRTDVLPWYHRNGYTTFQQIPLEKVRQTDTQTDMNSSVLRLCPPLGAATRG